MSTKTFDADLDHPWVQRYRIPRVRSSYPGWRYEVALVVPTPGDTFKLDGELLEPTEAEAEILGSFIEKRCTYYNERWLSKMRERVFDVDSSTNTVILAKTAVGWRYRLDSHQDGLCPFFNEQDKQAKFPPTAAGLVAILDHICWDKSWQTWMADHPRIEQLARS